MKQRRLERMRLGQETCVIHPMPSNPDINVALVSLTEAEYDNALVHSMTLDVPDTTAGNQVRDRRSQQEILWRAMRNPDNLSEKIFNSAEELKDTLDWSDINFYMDAYFELAEIVAPSVASLNEEEIDELKKVLREISWSELSGGQWYALKRFLLSLSPEQLLGRLPGSFSTNP